MSNDKRGLILEGGAMRGLFTAGITDVMMEHDVWPDGIVGVSAGAAFGCNYKSRQPGRAIRYNKRFAKDARYSGLRSLLSTGDSWWRFYCLYLRYYLQGHRARKKYANAGYWLNPFEIEAYEHMHDLSYLEQCKNGATEWRRFADMTIDERIAYKTHNP